jgi:RimJ/RimL family protein N-acetyltransferase
MSITRPDGALPMIAHGSVYLRPAEREDIPRFVAWLADARTTRTLALIAPLSIAQEEAWFERVVAAQGRERWHFVICRRDDDRPVGVVGLDDLDLVNGSAPLGIFIGDAADQGRGYGSDAIQALLRFAFDSLRLERVWLDVYAFNERATRVYERAGFVREGVLRHALWREGQWWDDVRMAILAGEWRAQVAERSQGSEDR